MFLALTVPVRRAAAATARRSAVPSTTLSSSARAQSAAAAMPGVPVTPRAAPGAAFAEFFDTTTDFTARQPTGRAWTVAELRRKSFSDLHALWFVCLKERNLLLTERLYYRQVGQSAPEPSRLGKVRAAMRGIKVVVGERARAGAAADAADAMAARVAAAVARAAAAAADAARHPVDRLLRPAALPPRAPSAAAAAAAARVPRTAAAAVAAAKRAAAAGGRPGAAAAAAAAAAGAAARAAAAAAVSAAHAGVRVTYKKFGRKYEDVPAERAPARPTAAERKRAQRTRRFFASRTALLARPPTVPPPSEAFLWATRGGAAAGEGGAGAGAGGAGGGPGAASG